MDFTSAQGFQPRCVNNSIAVPRHRRGAGTYVPADPIGSPEVIQTEDGSEIDAVVLGRVRALMRRHLDLEAHLWVAYPRFRDPDQLLQLVGGGAFPPTSGGDDLPEGDGIFRCAVS